MIVARQLVSPHRQAYLSACSILDTEQPEVRELARSLRGDDALETARRCFEFVRDRIEHSGDSRRSPTTASASEVLRAGHGYCYAKSHLLAALLRCNGLAAGLGYQRLTVDGPSPPHCLHGYVVVELPVHGWYAIDARGNKPGVDARFDPPHEQLAFAIQHEGERDFMRIYAEPLPEVIACLRTHATWDAVMEQLPDALALS